MSQFNRSLLLLSGLVAAVRAVGGHCRSQQRVPAPAHSTALSGRESAAPRMPSSAAGTSCL